MERPAISFLLFGFFVEGSSGCLLIPPIIQRIQQLHIQVPHTPDPIPTDLPLALHSVDEVIDEGSGLPSGLGKLGNRIYPATEHVGPASTFVVGGCLTPFLPVACFGWCLV